MTRRIIKNGKDLPRKVPLQVAFSGGLGDRHQQDGVNYTLDLNAGLPQVLSDGTNTYLYGNGRISQHDTGTPDTSYFLGDALGSVRQLADSAGAVTLTQSYAPYGEVTQSIGASQTTYAFTGENLDANGLMFLRARYYAPQDGRFISRDVWAGDYQQPLSLNKWSYVGGNPVNKTDPSGLCWYWDFNTKGIKQDLLDINPGPCEPFVEFLDQQGIDYLPSNVSPDNFLDSLSPEHRDIFLSAQPCYYDPVQAAFGTGADYWMVVKYSTSTKWKYYETDSTGVSLKLILGFGGGGGLSCDNYSMECTGSAQLEIGKGIATGDIKLAIGFGVGAEYTYRGAFRWGGYADIGPCNVFLSSTKISGSCQEPLTGQIYEWGWSRLKYREYLVLVKWSTINQAGGYIKFAKRYLEGLQQYDETSIRYDIWRTHPNKEPLQFQFRGSVYNLTEYP